MANTKGSVAFPGALDDVVSLLNTVNSVSTALLQGTLNASVLATDTSITASVLGSLGGYPAADGAITIDDEIIYYDSATVVSNVVTFAGCLRGQDGTTAAAHSSGTTVFCYAVSAQRKLLRDAVLAVEAKLGSGSSTPTASTWLKGTGVGTSAWNALTAVDITTALGNTLSLTGAGIALTLTNNAQIGGRIWLGSVSSQLFTFPAYGIYQSGGGISAAPLGAPGGTSVTNHGTAGATTYTYHVNAIDRLGNYTNASIAKTTTGNATLNGTNYNSISWGAVPGAVTYEVARTGFGGYVVATGIAGTSVNDQGSGAGATNAVAAYDYTGDAIFGTLRLMPPQGDLSEPFDTTTASIGQMWYSASQHALKLDTELGASVVSNAMVGNPISSVLSGTTIGTTETAFGSAVRFNANSLVSYKVIHVFIGGVWTATTAPTQIFTLRMNDYNGNIVNLLTTGTATTLLASSLTNAPWQYEAWISVQTTVTPSSGQLAANGRLTSATSVSTYIEMASPRVMGTAVATVDFTVAQTLELSMKLGSAGTNFSVTIDTFVVEILN